MYTARFFRTPLGQASLISIAAMLLMNCLAVAGPAQASARGHIVASPAAITGELA